MDQYNVLDLTTDLNKLENDMATWSNLPYKFRMRSNDECIRKYNMTNVELYNKMKALIQANAPVNDDPEYLNNFVVESTKLDSDQISDEEYGWRKGLSEQLNLSPAIVVIIPFRNDDKNYTVDELNTLYNKYLLLNDKNRRYSNQYSLSLWGYNVPNVYEMILNVINTAGTDADKDNIIVASECSKKLNNIIDPVIQSVSKEILESDKLGLMLHKLDSCDKSIPLYESSIYNEMNNDIDKAIACNDFEDSVNKVTPYFTISEMQNMGCENKAADMKYEDYYKIVSEKMNEFEKDRTNSILENEIISLGWNPSISFNEKNIAYARSRQVSWLKEHAANIVDITKLNISSVNESSTSMRSLYKEKNLYPIYIVLSYSNTFFGNVITFVKNCTYSHAGLSMDSDLKTIYTYKFGFEFNGFHTESLETYSATSKNTIIDVLTIFVDKNTKTKVDAALKYYITNKDKTKYGFGNLINILFNKKKVYKAEDFSLVCSQFVDTVLKMSNIDISSKISNLVIPQDFDRVLVNNPKLFKVYEGLAIKYNEKTVENLLYTLFNRYSYRDIKYDESIDISKKYTSESFYCNITDNAEADKIVKEMVDMVTPTSILAERKLPIQISDDGSVTVELCKNLEDQYQEAHKLLSGYSVDNSEGIKHELARLFWINSVIEKKIKKLDKDNKNYKSLIDLRARVLNDFKRYFKILSESQPDFDFNKYFQKSEYYNGSITVDSGTLKFTGSLIKKFIKSLGI